MEKFTGLESIKLPQLPYVYAKGSYKYSSADVESKNTQILREIQSKYGKAIQRWSNVFEIAEPVLVSFIAVESGGEMVGKNPSGAIGLMQISSTSLRESVPKFKTVTKTTLPDEARSYLNAKAPYMLSLTPNSQTLSSANTASLEALLKNDAEFNIFAGALHLRWLMEFLKAGGKAHLNKVMLGYNQSAYGRVSAYKGKAPSSTTLFNDKVIPKETRDYLVKLLGKSGFLELYAKANL